MVDLNLASHRPGILGPINPAQDVAGTLEQLPAQLDGAKASGIAEHKTAHGARRVLATAQNNAKHRSGLIHCQALSENPRSLVSSRKHHS
jgi:hypothetical protein